MPRLKVKEDTIVHSDAQINELRRIIMGLLLEEEARVHKNLYLENFEKHFSRYKSVRRKKFQQVCARKLRKSPDGITSEAGGPIDVTIAPSTRGYAADHRLAEIIETAADASFGFRASGHRTDKATIDRFNWKSPLSFEVSFTDLVMMEGGDTDEIKNLSQALIDRLAAPRSVDDEDIMGEFGDGPDEESSTYSRVKDRLNKMIARWGAIDTETPSGSISFKLSIDCEKEIDVAKKWHPNEEQHAELIKALMKDEIASKLKVLGWSVARLSLEAHPI